MNQKRIMIGLTIIGLLIIVTLATVIKIKENEINEKYNFIVDNFVFYAKKCVKEEKCTKNTVTIKELYDNEYLSEQINPKTKNSFNEKSYIKVLDYKFVLID